MEKRMISENMLEAYQKYLKEEEKSEETIQKYMRDICKFMAYADGKQVNKAMLVKFKRKLWEEGGYKISSINSFLVAVNRFLEYLA